MLATSRISLPTRWPRAAAPTIQTKRRNQLYIMSEECNTSAEDKTPGIFSWRELVTQDPEGSSKFYTDLLGWTTNTMPMPGGMDYTMFMSGDRPAAGMMKPPGEKDDGRTSWISYITVEDLDATVAKSQELGAHLCIPVTEISGKGRFAGVADPQGAAIAFWEYTK